MKRTLLTLGLALCLGCMSSVIAKAKTKHTTTMKSSTSLATERFAGTYRATPKTSLARNGSAVASVKQYKDLHALLVTLPSDASMRAKYPGLKKGLHKGWPDFREPEEIRNVRIKNCWIVSAKHEGGAGDHDFHVILSNSPTNFSEVMNAEVSALPKTNTADFSKLKDVRAVFLTIATNLPPSGSFTHLTPPKHVMIEGSLYFDGEHGAGGKSDPGPAWAKPQSVFELHPVYKLTALAN